MGANRTTWRAWCLGLLLSLSPAPAADAVETLFEGHVNGRVEGFEAIDPAAFRAEPMTERYYTEIWFHEMQFVNEGFIVIVNVQLHNLGVSHGYCDSYISISGPDGIIHLDKDTFKPKEVRVDPQGFGIAFGPHRIELQGDQYQIRYRGKSIQADLTCRSLAPSYRQGDGTVRFDKKDQFVTYSFPIPWAEVAGTLTREGAAVALKGVGSMNHDRQVLSPKKYMNRWRVGWFYGKDATVSIVRCTSPDLEGRWVQRLMVAEQGRILFSSHDYKYEEFDAAPVPGAPIPCPGRSRVEAVHGNDWIKGSYSLNRIQEKKDILADYPYLFRQLAKLITKETWSYRYWADFDFQLSLEGNTRPIKGVGTAHFIEPVPAD